MALGAVRAPARRGRAVQARGLRSGRGGVWAAGAARGTVAPKALIRRFAPPSPVNGRRDSPLSRSRERAGVRATSALLSAFDRGERFGHFLVHLFAQAMIGEVDVAAFEVGLQRRGDVVVVVADLRGDEGVGVFLSVRRRQPLHVGGPESDRLVAARDRAKAN